MQTFNILKQLVFYWFIGLLFFLNACQPTVQKAEKKQKLFVKHYVRFLQNDRLYHAETQFLSGDSLHNAHAVKMEEASFQGGSMEVREVPGRAIHYKTERSGPFQSQLKFKYRDEKGRRHSTDYTFEPIPSFLLKNGISKSRGLTLVWKGLPLQDRESLLLFLGDQDNKATSTTIPGPTSRAEVQVDGEFLKDLEPGKGNLFLVRKQEGKQAEEERVINYELEYYTQPIEVEIKE